MTVVNAASQAPAVSQPRQLIVSLFGLYARQNANWLPIASVVRLMAELGVDGQAVRSAISRLKRRGLLDSCRRHGAAGYTLTPTAQAILVEGDARIFGRRRATVSDGWLVVVYSVPEIERDRRHVLRANLTRLGFGTVAPGVWIAPGHLERDAIDALRRLEVTDYTEILRGQHVAFGNVQDKAPKWWDLEALGNLYRGFVQRYRPTLDQVRDGTLTEEAALFAEYVEMLTEWRQLPYADPGLPLELLPLDWPGLDAEELFGALRATLSGPAGAHAARILGD